MRHYIYFQDKLHLIDRTNDIEAENLIKNLFLALLFMAAIALLAILF